MPFTSGLHSSTSLRALRLQFRIFAVLIPRIGAVAAGEARAEPVRIPARR